jgi:hypothetical protein
LWDESINPRTAKPVGLAAPNVQPLRASQVAE